jgi:microsomal dipeptidase-like Zn-dependent dipeptidase
MAKGFADLHNHQFANLGFGGKAFWGAPYGDIAHELTWCTRVHGPGGIGDLLGNAIRKDYGGGVIGLLGHKVGGHPQFDGWPRWDSVSHQSVFEDWLHRAVEGGLRLMVMLAVNNEFMCGKINKLPGRTCNDMEAVDLQLQAAHDMEVYIDEKTGGPGQGWYRIVKTPAEAHAVIEAGKLAVVLGIEVDYLFNCHAEGDLTEDQLRQKLDRYYALDVRHLFPIHFSNNGFGGTAFQNPLIRDSGGGLVSDRNPVGTIGAYTIDTEDGQAWGYQYRAGRRNARGLTARGKTLIREMIARGMIIDVDHMSARSKGDTFDICEAADYPVVSGHTGFVDISNGDKRHEGQLLAEEIERIRTLGGIIAPIVHQGDLNQINTWRGPDQTVVEHTCGNTSNTIIQAFLYAVSKMQGGAVGLGTDFNGFAGLPGPRFGADASPGGHIGPPPEMPLSYPFLAAATGQRLRKSVIGEKTFDFNYDGLAHVGMLPDLIADIENQGLNADELAPLLNSAEAYVALWGKAIEHVAPIPPPPHRSLRPTTRKAR